MMTEMLTGSMNYLPHWILFIFQQQFIGGETLFGVKPIWVLLHAGITTGMSLL